ncbi:M14 family zinc carboxypeptidase [Flavobacterium sp. LB3R33]|uniref:M14 family zinc carboxypeptidase n=1 Tax=Flavobacterium sp. LB3R33 TaxID=3401721 RepID=UPI003AB0CE2B
MKKTTFIFLLILCFNSFLYSQSENKSSEIEKQTNEIYKKIKIKKPSSDLMNKLGACGLDLECGSQFDTNGDLLIEISSQDEVKVKKITSYQVVITNLEDYYSKRAIKNLSQAKLNLRTSKLKKSTNKNSSLKNTTYGNITHRFENDEIDWAVPTNYQLGASFGGCLTIDETYAQLDKMHALYPNLITVKTDASPSNQKTIGNRSIYVVKISNSSITGAKPETLYTGMTHSREVVSLMNLTYYMWYLLENYATNPDVKNLVDNHELYFIPIVNPDGLAYNQAQSPNGGGMQRKNRRETGSCSTYLDGVDLNRNWGTYWGYDDTGSSNIGCDDTYRGTAGFSEAETSIVKDFFLLHNFKTSVNHHSYKNAALHGRAAYYYTNNNPSSAENKTGREDEYYQYSHDMTQYSRYAYGSSPNISYWNNGNSNDWMLTGSGKNTLGWTPENGAANESTILNNGFWPDPINITAISKRAMRMNFIAGFYSGVYAKLHDLTKSDITTTNGTLNFGLERVGQTPGDFTLTVTPISSNILSVTNPTVQTGMTILEQRNINVNYTLNPGITNKEKIEFEVTLSNGNYIIYKTRLVKYYTPTVLFSSIPDTSNLTGWTASPTTGAWAVTATGGFGGTKGITASAAIPYANNINSTLTQTTGISLLGKQQVVVQFNAKWDIERSFDYVELQGSINGTTWIPLKGKYTKPGATAVTNDYSSTLTTASKTTTDKAFQPDAEPLYDGNKMNKWVLEEFFINASDNSELFNKATLVKFRFIFKTDSSNRKHGYNDIFDGFTFDDFKVIEIKSSPPVAICKDATLLLNSSGQLTVLPTDINNGSTDDVAITSISVSPNTFNCTHRNTTQLVMLTVTDADGQTSSCTSSVTIKDTTAPVIPILVTVSSQNAVTLTAPTTTDACAGTITGTTDTTFPITVQGTTVVVWTFDDASGQTVTANQNVIIDNSAPTAPTELVASGTTQTTTNLSWTASTDDTAVIGYDVYQGTTLRASVATTSYAVTGLTASTEYNFSVKAIDAAGNISTESIIVNVTTLDPIVDTTAPSAPASLIATGTTQTSTNLSWTTSTDDTAVTGYDVYQGTTLRGSVTTTSYAVAGLAASTAYTFSVKAKDAAGNISVSSNIISVTTSAPIATYCDSKGNSVTKEKIGKVVFGTINNTTTGGTGYENFTTIATNATRGTAYTITITPSWTSTKYKEGYGVWIDYNGDGDFVDAGEQVFTKTASTTTPVTGSITIPATAKIGVTRMRVSMKYNAIPTSCETFASGQVEDYTVNITSPIARTIETSKDKEITNDIVVYPNPTTSILNVTSVSENATFKIYNIIGQTIMKGKLSNNSINVTAISQGNYVLEITDKETTTTKRFVKQ